MEIKTSTLNRLLFKCSYLKTINNHDNFKLVKIFSK